MRHPAKPLQVVCQRVRDAPRWLLNRQQTGLVLVILALAVVLTAFSGTHVDRRSGAAVNNFLNSGTLMQVATDASFFAVMAIGATIVIISGGIDLSVGSVYAVAGVTMALVLRSPPQGPLQTVGVGILVSLGIGLICGVINGLMIVGLRVHSFVITLGTMWIFRGIAFVTSRATSVLVPDALTGVAKANFGLGPGLYPMPMAVMIVVTLCGAIYLSHTVMGRHVFAVGGNVEASRYAGLRIERIQLGVFALSGLAAGIAAFMGTSYYGSASCADASGYELYVIASAVVGGASLKGGRGSAVSATLGALLIVLIRQSIRSLRLDQNYEWIIIGCAIIVAVVLDRVSTALTSRRLTAVGDTHHRGG
ncbi:ABC transporter permease [Candidatus Fermentibacteria bacterium]|nr:ABC transporter permease [Candidatus Fermentibacteria bacterium]